MSTIGSPTPPHFLDEGSRVSLPSLVGRRVTLKRSGSPLRGPCPIHGSAKALTSFSVRDSSYRCFVCGEPSDAISFVMWADRLTVPEAAPKHRRILTEIVDRLIGEHPA